MRDSLEEGRVFDRYLQCVRCRPIASFEPPFAPHIPLRGDPVFSIKAHIEQPGKIDLHGSLVPRLQYAPRTAASPERIKHTPALECIRHLAVRVQHWTGAFIKGPQMRTLHEEYRKIIVHGETRAHEDRPVFGGNVLYANIQKDPLARFINGFRRRNRDGLSLNRFPPDSFGCPTRFARRPHAHGHQRHKGDSKPGNPSCGSRTRHRRHLAILAQRSVSENSCPIQASRSGARSWGLAGTRRCARPAIRSPSARVPIPIVYYSFCPDEVLPGVSVLPLCCRPVCAGG